MARMTSAQVLQHEAEFARKRLPQRQVVPTTEAVREERENVQHNKIMAWCDAQWPRWKYIHARMDMPSTLPVGCQDFAIFGPFPICLLVECKASDGKVDPDQRIWIKEMEMLGWKVHVTWSYDEFLALAESEKAKIQRV